MKKRRRLLLRRTPRRERGAILVVSLMLLLILTVLAVTSMRLSTTQERLAGNVRDVDLSFQAAEAAAREAEARLLRAADNPPTCGGPCPLTDGVLPAGTVADPQSNPASFETFWAANAQPYGGAGRQIQPTSADPTYAVEALRFVPDDLGIGTESRPEGRMVYRVIARGAGGTDMAQSIIETTVARR